MIQKTQSSFFKHALDALQGISRPVLFLDLDAFDRNIERMRSTKSTHKIRLATKSLRCPKLIDYVLRSSSKFEGLMCYSPHEALYWANKDCSNVLLAYPIVDQTAMSQIFEGNLSSKIIFCVNQIEHLKLLELHAEKNNHTAQVCIDLDTAMTLPVVYFGARRSNLKSQSSVEQMLKIIKSNKNLTFTGYISYEGQIAGVKDSDPQQGLLNPIIRLLKKINIPRIKSHRTMAREIARKMNMPIEIFNGGGTGSLCDAFTDRSLTEVSAGSGLYCPHLFDHYANLNYEPALYFALDVTRTNHPDWLTAHGGGFIASGSVGPDRQPIVVFPEGLRTFNKEGFGEVQTPLFSTAQSKPWIEVGSTIILRPAKAGEICERFNEIVLIRNGTIVETAKTYRGLGLCFH